MKRFVSLIVLSLASLAFGQAPTQSDAAAPLKLPDGHPDITEMTQPASTQPVALGTLTVQAVQSTAGAAAVSGGKAVVEIYSQQHRVKSYDVELDASGKAVISDLPVSLEITPLVKVIHNDIEYTAQGSLMDSTHPAQQIDVPVYESTEQAPDWRIKMRHLMLQRAESGLQVMDVLQIENPADRAWTGTPDANGKGTTFVLPLPAGASDVQLIEGFHDCCTIIDAAGVHNQMALLPGAKLYRLAYTLPVQDGNVEIPVSSPAPAHHAMIFVPNDGSKVVADGLEVTQSGMGDGSTRFYKASDLQTGQTVKLSLTGVTASAATTSPAPSATSVATLAKAIAGAGSILILLLGGAFMFLRAPKEKRA